MNADGERLQSPHLRREPHGIVTRHHASTGASGSEQASWWWHSEPARETRVAPSGQTSLFSAQCAIACRLSMPPLLRLLAVIMWGRVPPTPPSRAPAQRGLEGKAVGLPPFCSAFPSCPLCAGRAVARRVLRGLLPPAPPSPPSRPPAKRGEVPPTTPKSMLT